MIYFIIFIARWIMKKIKIIIAVIVSAILCLQTQTAFAVTEYSDGVYTFAKTEHGSALITDCALTEETVSIPEFVLGYPVTGIGDYAFFSNSYVKEVTLPPGAASIGEYAFAGNNDLEYVTIPRWCDNIAENAFWHSPNVTIKCFYDSGAYEFAAEKGINCELLDIVPGDADNDGTISINDVTAIQCHLAGIEELTGIGALNADTDGSGAVDINDATHLQRYLAEFDVALGKQAK